MRLFWVVELVQERKFKHILPIFRRVRSYNVLHSHFYTNIFVIDCKQLKKVVPLPFILSVLVPQVAMTHPMAVTNCNIDMESLISDQNRSIATLAITTLLKTGNESSVDRLMKQITNFMSDIADEFKIVVVEAIRSLCLKFPLKYRSLWVISDLTLYCDCILGSNY